MARAVLYIRVSTDEQIKGYSLDQQEHALREYCQQHNLEVIDVARDAGESGYGIERPGIERVLDMAASGSVDVVVAQDVDRLGREGWHYGYLQSVLEKHGVKLKALDVDDNEDPDSVLLRYVKLGQSEGELAKFKKRTMRGRNERARQGKPVSAPPYGFRYADNGDSFEVDHDTMPVVRRMFKLLAEDGYSLQGVKHLYESEGIKPPAHDQAVQRAIKAGKEIPPPRWIYTSMARMIRNDAYYARPCSEIADKVPPPAYARLVAGKSYGLYEYGRYRVERTRERTPGGGKRRRFTAKDEADWINIPVPDCGIPTEHVQAARAAIGNGPTRSKPGSVFWELQGLGYCGACGSLLTPYGMKDGKTGKPYSYYTCMKRRKHGKKDCPDGATIRSDHLESEVLQYVEAYINEPEKIAVQVEQAIEREREKLRDPDANIRALHSEIQKLEQRRANYQDQQSEGLISMDRLRSKLADLDEQQGGARAELARLEQGNERVRQLEENKRVILETFGKGLNLGLNYFPARMRRAIYEMLNLRITADSTGIRYIEADISASFVRYTRDVEEYAQRLRDAEKRIEQTMPDGMTTRQQVEHIERELEKIKREFSTQNTDAVMAEVAG